MRRVGYLLDEIRLHGDNKELKDEVTELARKYSIVTPYTAYLIIEDEARRGVPILSQSLPQLQQDLKAREATAHNYNTLMMERYGLGSVTRSRSELALKSANAPADAVMLGNKESLRGFFRWRRDRSVPGIVGDRSECRWGESGWPGGAIHA